LSRVILQEQLKITKDHQVFAGLLNVDSSYPIYADESCATKAREDAVVTTEEANGKKAYLVAFFEGEKLILHRTFDGETYHVYYTHYLTNNDNTLVVDLKAINGDEEVKTQVKFTRETK